MPELKESLLPQLFVAGVIFSNHLAPYILS